MPVSRILPVLMSVLAVGIGVALLRPTPEEVIWHRLQARPETDTATQIYAAAQKRPTLTIPPGTYTFTDQRGPHTLRITLHFPRGVTSTDAPFRHTATLSRNGTRDDTRTASGRAVIQGHVLILTPQAPNWMLSTPRDRTLIRTPGPTGFSAVVTDPSPNGRTELRYQRAGDQP